MRDHALKKIMGNLHEVSFTCFDGTYRLGGAAYIINFIAVMNHTFYAVLSQIEFVAECGNDGSFLWITQSSEGASHISSLKI